MRQKLVTEIHLSSGKTGYILNLCTVYNDTHYFKQLPLNNATIDTFENLIRHQTKSNFIKKAKIDKLELVEQLVKLS